MSEDLQRIAYEQFSDYIKSIPHILSGIDNVNYNITQVNTRLDKLNGSVKTVAVELQEHVVEDTRVQTQLEGKIDYIIHDKSSGTSLRPQYYAVIVAVLGIIISFITATATVIVPLMQKVKP